MAIEPVYETLNINVRKQSVTDRIKAECRTDIPADGIKRIINVSSFATILSAKTAENKIEYSGRIAFFISYEQSDGEIKKCECGSEFTGMAAAGGVTPECFAAASVCTEREEADLAGVKLTVCATAQITFEVTERQSYPALTGGEGLLVKTGELSYGKSTGLKEGATFAEEKFTVNARVEEMLCQRAQTAVTAVQCGVGVIIVDGEVYFSAILLQTGEKKDIIRENKTIPFRAEIECEAAMPAFTATARAAVKSLKTEIRVDEEQGISEITVQAAIILTGEGYSDEIITIVQDAFSTTEDIKLEHQPVDSDRELPPITVCEKVSNRAVIDEIPVGANLCAVCCEKAEIAQTERVGGKIKIMGAADLSLIFVDADGGIFSRKTEIPFDSEFESSVPQEAALRVCAIAENGRARLVSLTEVQAEVQIVFTVYAWQTEQITFVKSALSQGQKPTPEYAISVFIPVKGEQLWETAKRLSVAPEKLAETNRDLVFPLTGEERIVVYREKG